MPKQFTKKFTKKFTRTIEDFTCDHCGQFVSGNGYTNHCPKCLWSKHVDIAPGDRKASCGGLMEPSLGEIKGGESIINHACLSCGFQRKNKMAKEDSFEAAIALAERKN